MFSYRRIFVTLLLTTAISNAQTTFQPSGASFKGPVTVASGLTAEVVFSNLTSPSGIAFDEEQNLLVVERGFGVSALTRANGGWERTVVLENADLTYGIQVEAGVLHVSTADSILTYFYDAATKSVTDSWVAVDGIPSGVLPSHDFLLEHDAYGNLRSFLIGTGPLENIDTTARDPANGRSQIRRVTFPEFQILIFPPPALHWSDGQVVTFGQRNPAGFEFGPDDGLLYVAENSASIGGVPAFGGAFANDNPADELNVVDTSAPAKSYGFPDCATVGNPLGMPFARGDQFSLGLDPARNNAWCQDDDNNEPPALLFEAHVAPVDIKFYERSTRHAEALPGNFARDAFVAFFGSFERDPPTGYGVVNVPFPLQSESEDYTYIVQATNINACPDELRCITPVGLEFDAVGRLFVSSDLTGEVFLVRGGL